MAKEKKEKTKVELAAYPDLLQTLLRSRGITTSEAAEKFLHPSYEDFSDPFLLHDMKPAVDRIVTALATGEMIGIYADYDADGVPGAAILSDFFEQLGYTNYSVTIPHRHDDGYGLHGHLVEQLADAGVKLMITIDLGTTANDVIDQAAELGMDVIITDHHEAGDVLPEAVAIVNPKLGAYPDPMLCGAATIFQVVRALIQVLRTTDETLFDGVADYAKVVQSWPEGHHKWWLDLVGLSTIADMVPLRNENRILAHYGLLVGQKTRRAGLRALSRVALFSLTTLDEQDIGFSIAPRINSASRMEHASEAYKLLATRDPLIAETQAKKLQSLNDRRKRVSATTVKQAKKILAERTLRDVIVVGHPDWNPGVLSILSGKLSDQHQKSVFVWTTHGPELIKGSARAAEGQSVLEMMRGVSSVFQKFGGHQAAGGFTCHRDQIHTLEEKLQQVFQNLYGSQTKNKGVVYTIDAELSFQEATRDLWRQIRQLAPFGLGNPEPVFLFSNGMVQAVRQFGKHSDHLELVIKDNQGQVIKVIAFYKTASQYSYTPQVGEPVRIVGNLVMNRFLGKEELRISLIDILPA